VAFVSAMWLLNAPGSALNNRGLAGGRTENLVEVKKVRAADGTYAYVSAQACRYWLRSTLATEPDWHASPLLREAKVVYTDANPIEWDDDDLFGYMRAPGGSEKARQSRASQGAALPTAVEGEVTRISPLRLSPLVSVAPAAVVSDFGTASRHEGPPVPYEHEFYRTVLKGLVSLDLGSVGVFTSTARSGFRNLDPVRVRLADERKLERGTDGRTYRLPTAERARRAGMVLRALARLAGGAKMATHYTDVTPTAILAVVMRGANNPFQYAVTGRPQRLLAAQPTAVAQAVAAWSDQFLSPVYLGWVAGFQDDVAGEVRAALEDAAPPHGLVVDHPRPVLERLAADLGAHAAEWMD
jgi:CRISPR-associated protein Cst2